jgi:hypothetical protein
MATIFWILEEIMLIDYMPHKKTITGGDASATVLQQFNVIKQG